MHLPNIPIALNPLLCTDFVNFILRHHTTPTTLIICSSREAFLQELQACIEHTHPRDPTADPNDETSLDGTDPPPHPLLIPTIHLIAKSRSVNLAFVPTLPHLRAYLATYTHDFKPESSPSTSTKPGSQYPMLAVWGLASLHRSTAEHSAQGLSRSLAIAIETAKLNGQRLVLAESRASNGEVEYEGIGSGGEPWKEEVPLLSGSVRFGGEDRAWAGKRVEVGKVVGRWCQFVTVGDGG
ncbi:MAG: hypothetical protein ASARMPREDX12_007802 [Alectoria sarmentosa]|nr:MAG: hypothetical protein ASARMPRED_002582 [Alectoria sarmentosa]CAD6576237.1 MAG: hypothetical protein ASARMPREDX12_007802 [Alectoria sarmentosa]